MHTSKWLRHKNVLQYHFKILGISGPKCAYILNYDAGKPQNWKTFRCLSNFKF